VTLSWQQVGDVSNYTVQVNDTETSFVVSGVGNVSATVSNLPISGSYYCISVSAVSGHLYSEEAHLCDYTGKLFSFLSSVRITV